MVLARCTAMLQRLIPRPPPGLIATPRAGGPRGIAVTACRRALLALAAVALPAVAADPAQPATPTEPISLSLLAPTDRGLRADLAWLVDRGVLSLPLGTWPMASSTLQAAWLAADLRHLNAADADALARVQRAVRRSTDSVRLGVRVNSARHPALDASSAARGSASAELAFYAGSAQWGGQLTLGSSAESLTPDGQQANLDGSYLAVLLPGAVVSGGVTDRWWGPGQFTSPILSNAARPIASVIVRRAEDTAPETAWLRWVGQWGYELSAGRLAHYTPDGTRTIGLRLYTRPWANVELGISRSILWAGQGRPHNWVALRDALLGNSNINDPTTDGDDPSDEISGFDLRVSAADPWGGAWVGYLHFLGEDEAGGLPSKSFGTLGVQAKTALAGQRWEATFEATDTVLSRMFGHGVQTTKSSAYTHGTYTSGYYQGRLPIGANIGGAGYLYTLGLGWTPIDNPDLLRVYGTVFRGHMSETGPQTINAAFGTEAPLTGGSLAIEGETAAGVRWQLGLSVQRYRGGDRPVTGLQAGIELPLYTGR